MRSDAECSAERQSTLIITREGKQLPSSGSSNHPASQSLYSSRIATNRSVKG